MNWFSDNTWVVWAGLAVLLAVAELLSLDLVLLMLAAGAGVGALAGLVGLPLPVQVLVAVATAMGMLALVRPEMIRRLHSGPDLVSGHQKLVGKVGLVLEEVSSQGGRVRINGEVWSARPFDDDAVIEPGARVDVFEIRGAMAVVHKIPELD